MKVESHRVQGLICGVVLLWSHMASAWAEEAPQPVPGMTQATGVVVATSGAQASIVAAGSSRLANVGELVTAGEALHIPTNARIAVLWDHRVLFTLHDDAHMQIEEPHRGQTEVHLHRGTVRIALSYNAGRMTDRLMLQTALARVMLRGGIMEAMVEGEAQRSILARLLSASSVETFRVVEGQAQVEPLTGERKSFPLKTGSEVSLTSGAAASVRQIELDARAGPPLALKEAHRGLPDSLTRQIVSTHIGLAVEAEQELQRAARAGSERELSGSSVNGALLPTSLGLPSSPGVQALGTGSATGSSSFSTSPSSITAPSGATPLQGIGSLGPAQSGGRNSNELLQQIIKESDKGPKGGGKK